MTEFKAHFKSVQSDLGGSLPGRLNFGIPGKDGGYYLVAAEQVDANTIRFTFTPSQKEMPAVDPVDITLPNATGAGLTTAQINALHGMFKVCLFDDSKDVDGAISAFEAAFGLPGGGEEPDEPDIPDVPDVKTYSVSAELIKVTSSNKATTVNENASYTATLTADEDYEISNVTVTMGGVDVTADVYADGVIFIPAVTGNVEIVASATLAVESEAELITDGLLFDFDFRNATMASYNLTGWGNVYAMKDKHDYALIFGTSAITGDDIGISKYPFRENRLVSAETTKIQLGETYTAQALYRATSGNRVQPDLFGFNSGSNITNYQNINPIYLVGTTETKVGQSSIAFNDPDGYILATYIVDGAILKIYFNESLIAEYNGADYEGFTKWVDYGCPNTVFTNGITVSFVGYNRALSHTEIVENIEYFKTLEVA
jgi:hypothetical protein